MQGKKENVNLQSKLIKKEKNIMNGYCHRKIKNFMYTSSIFSIIYSGNAIVERSFPEAVIGIGCGIGFYSIGKLIGTQKLPCKRYSNEEDLISANTDNQMIELKKEKKCHTLFKHHD